MRKVNPLRKYLLEKIVGSTGSSPTRHCLLRKLCWNLRPTEADDVSPNHRFRAQVSKIIESRLVSLLVLSTPHSCIDCFPLECIREELVAFGVDVGPITSSTRGLWLKKLDKLNAEKRKSRR